MLQPKKPVVKVVKKTTVKVAPKYVPTAKEKKNLEDATQMKNMRPTGPTSGRVKAKNGKSFPDLNKDGKVTKADILKGRGVIAKKGMTVKKAQDGAKTADSTSYFRGRAKDMARKSLYAEGKGDKKLSDVYMDVASKSSSDASRQANKGKKGYDANGYPKKKAKTGASIKKCKYGCK